MEPSVSTRAERLIEMLRPTSANKLNVEETGVFSGYASVFDKVDLGRDRIARGAFSRSIRRKSVSGVRMLFQHDPSAPIGAWEHLEEDDYGLFVRGRLARDTRQGKEAYGLIKAGAIDGLSIGFRTLRSTRDRRTGIRTVWRVDLWEVSIVTFPMHPLARIKDVKRAFVPNDFRPRSPRTEP